jgi:Interferon-induced transmembrane protein
MTTPSGPSGQGPHRYPPPAPPGAEPPRQPPGVAPPPPPAWDAGRPYAPPPPAYPAADTGKPSAYWPLSILAILFSLIFGAIGIYFSAEVGNRWGRGDWAGARKASRTALTLDVIGIVVGVIVLIAAVSSSGSSGY